MRRNPFDVNKLKLFEKQNRGTGINDKYIPYHMVTRSDPSSTGRSGRYNFKGRLLHLLSSTEYVPTLFATMHTDLFDLREQFPLKHNNSIHEENDYTNGYGQLYPGTLEIAEKLNIKHPIIRGKGTFEYWKLTTDILITLKVENELKFIAVSCKKKYPKSERKIDLLRIEKEYWETRNVQWLLITPELYERTYYNLLRAHKPRFIPYLFDPELLTLIINRISETPCSYSSLYKHLKAQGFESSLIINTFWIGFWFGEIPMDVKVVFDPLKQIKLINKEDFLNNNPIYSGRTSWI